MSQEGIGHESNGDVLGRPPVDIWRGFITVVERRATPKKHNPDLKCKYCLKVICHGQPTKISVHIFADSLKSRMKYARYTPSRPPIQDEIGPDGLGTISLTEKNKFHLEVARAFLTSGIPFRVIEYREMLCILTMFRPGMTLPMRQELSTTLLDSIYAKEVTNVVCDEQHTDKYMSSQLARVIREVENIVGKESVCGVVTDNASNKRISWELLVQKILA
ncbi:Hypothetical protein PHPALM_16773 [Phytophthora palmivora]|uniref:DUF659 domain-containing protein n=1 Tax=Phytophthora palmivora TaxID=4796 RepID=A0A2P4XNY1_9STRA|nr:Hypothetical protein PHPALM_16773 [Phytophthora palmivora]